MSFFDTAAGSIIGDIGTGLVNFGLNTFSANKQYHRQRDLMKMQNEYNSPLNQRRRLEAANMHPALAMGNPPVEAATGQSPTAAPAALNGNFGANSVAASQIRLNHAQEDLVRGNVDKTLAETYYQKLKNGNFIREANDAHDLNVVNVGKTKAEKDKLSMDIAQGEQNLKNMQQEYDFNQYSNPLKLSLQQLEIAGKRISNEQADKALHVYAASMPALIAQAFYTASNTKEDITLKQASGLPHKMLADLIYGVAGALGVNGKDHDAIQKAIAKITSDIFEQIASKFNAPSFYDNFKDWLSDKWHNMKGDKKIDNEPT